MVYMVSTKTSIRVSSWVQVLNNSVSVEVTGADIAQQDVED